MSGAIGFDWPTVPMVGGALNDFLAAGSNYAFVPGLDGGKALRITPVAGVGTLQWSQNTASVGNWVHQFRFRLVDPPGGSGPILTRYRTAGGTIHVGLYLGSDGAIRAYVRNTAYEFGAPGIVPEVGRWYRLDLTIVNNPWQLRWWVDGVEQPSLSSAQASFALNLVIFGPFGDGSTLSGAMEFDHVVVKGPFSAAPAPFGDPYRVTYLAPSTEGIHNLPGLFSDDGANTPPTQLVSRVGDGPSSSTATWVRQDTTDGTAYLELRHAWDARIPVIGSVRLGYSQPAAQTGGPILRVYSSTDLWATMNGWSSVTGGKGYRQAGIEIPTPSPAALRNLLYRWGYRTGGSVDNRFQDVHSEWAYVGGGAPWHSMQTRTDGRTIRRVGFGFGREVD